MSDIIKGKVWVNGKPFDEWTIKEHRMWQEETLVLIKKTEQIKAKLVQYAFMKGWMK